jgi:hypothetical protein
MKIRLSLWILTAAVAFTALGCAFPKTHNLPPAQQLLEPGPGVGGPGPGVLPPALPPMVIPVSMPTVQVLFTKPEGMQVRWDLAQQGAFDSPALIVPGRQNFPQNALYRLKITNLEKSPGVELYPTIEIGPTTPRSEAFLAHNAVPVQFTDEDLDQVLAGNFVTKVIYLPDPEFQELALAGVDTLVSTRLDPGVDPITEADRRGAILAIIRLGNKDVELPGSSDGNAGLGMNGGVLPCVGEGGYGSVPPNYVAGVTAPMYGMPMVGTPIGLPGPPHIPYGGPAGLQKHVMVNRTHMHIPQPTSKFKISVRQQPGQSYPKPASRVHIREQSIHPVVPFGQPHNERHERIGTPSAHGGGYGAEYGPGQ